MKLSVKFKTQYNDFYNLLLLLHAIASRLPSSDAKSKLVSAIKQCIESTLLYDWDNLPSLFALMVQAANGVTLSTVGQRCVNDLQDQFSKLSVEFSQEA